MMRVNFKNHRYYSRFIVLRRFMNIIGVKPVHIILPICLSFLVAVFDGISLGLLAPLAKGIVTNNFDFIKTIPGLKQIINIAPRLFTSSLTHNKSMFIFIITMIFAAVVFKNLFSYISDALHAYWRGRFNRNMYKFTFNRFLDFGKLFFDRTSQGYLQTVLGYSSRVLSLFKMIEDFLKDSFTLLIYFIIMLLISWKLTIASLVIFPTLHYTSKFIIKKISKVSELSNKLWIVLNTNVFNILTCIPLVKAYSQEENTKKKYADMNEELRKMQFKIAMSGTLITPIQDIITTAALLVMVSIVALLLARDKPAEISIFLVFFVAARRTLPLFNIFNTIRLTFAKLKPPLKELVKVFDDKDKFYVIEGNKVFGGLQKGIEYRDLKFSYREGAPVLKGIGFFVEKGKMTAIVGPSGAGKTTLISLLMRFYDCPDASIIVDGEDIRNFTLKSLRRHMVLVSQEAFLFNETLRYNITFGLDKEIKEVDLIDVAQKARIYDFISQLPNRFDTQIGDRGVKLSTGEKQRVALARALLKGSEIMILDEATSSLDTRTEKLIQQAIDEVVKGRTAIVIAHRLSTIKSADKIVVIEEGKLVEEGSLNYLLEKKGHFYKYWEAQKFY